MEAIRINRWSGSDELPAAGAGDAEQRFLTLTEVAAYCGVPFVEVRDWISSGSLKATLLENGRYRVGSQDFLAMVYRMLAVKARQRH